MFCYLTVQLKENNLSLNIRFIENSLECHDICTVLSLVHCQVWGLPGYLESKTTDKEETRKSFLCQEKMIKCILSEVNNGSTGM